MPPQETAFYDLLQVSPTATAAEIRKSFRILALKHHPDRAGNSPEATAHFQNLRAVHDLLLDPERRAIYDADGDDGTLHGGEPLDAEAAAAFFAGATVRVTKEEIVEYERRYRGGDDEREDLNLFFNRFEGKVGAVLEYIPFSEQSDLIRFVAYWDEEILNGKLQGGRAYEKAKKKLLKMAKGKERDLHAPVQNEGKEHADSANGQLSLVAQILAKKRSREESFDAWADGIAARAEQRAKEKTDKKKKRRTKKAKQGAIAK